MLTEDRVTLDALMKGAEGIQPADGSATLVSGWRALSTRVLAWSWPAGAIVALGFALLLLRAQALDRLGMSLALATLTLPAIWLVAVVYPRTLPTHGHQRVCWVVVGAGGLNLAGSAQAATQRKPVWTLVVLTGGRGLALVGERVVVELRAASVTVDITCSARGRVLATTIVHADGSRELRAYGRIPRTLLAS